jgi:hypothetical protein
MSEEQNVEKAIEEAPKEEIKEETLSAIDAAKKIQEQIAAENDRREEILKREEKLHAERMLAGTAGGGIPKEEPKEETPEEYAKRVISGDLN